MSTLNVNEIQHSSGAGSNITLDNQGNVECAADVQMASQNGGQLAGFRNQLINGSLDVNARGMTTSDVTSTGNEYIIDRWCTRSGETFRLVNSPVGTPCARAIQWTGGCSIRQGIELPSTVGGNGLAGPFQVGTQWTFSFYSNVSGVADFNVTAAFVNSATVGGAVTDSQVVTCTEVETSTNYSRYAATVTVNAAPTNTNRVYRWSLARGSNNFLTTGFMVEPGPVATPFEHRPIATELALCQRYYQTVSSIMPLVRSSNAADRSYRGPRVAEMRANPTETGTAANTDTANPFSSTTSEIRIYVAANNPAGVCTISDYTADAEL